MRSPRGVSEQPIEGGGCRYRPLASLVLGITILFAAQAVLYLAKIMWYVGMASAVRRSGVPTAFASYEADWLRFLTFSLIIGIPGTLAFLVWVHTTNRNARALGAADMSFTPGWSVGWFFVPIANLFMPLSVLRELWSTSDPGMPATRTPPLLAAGWILYISGQALHIFNSGPVNAQVAAGIAGVNRNQPGASLVGAFQWMGLAAFLSACSFVLAILVVRKVFTLQAQRNFELAAPPG